MRRWHGSIGRWREAPRPVRGAAYSLAKKRAGIKKRAPLPWQGCILTRCYESYDLDYEFPNMDTFLSEPQGGGARTNVEIKARCDDLAAVRRVLEEKGARRVGEDRQTDTYFRVSRGRLKLREGIIERYLIYYERPDEAGPKRSDVQLYEPGPSRALKTFLTQALGVRVVVEKRREIYFAGNVKFHLDRVEGLGRFVEIEAIDAEGARSVADLRAQCERYLRALDIAPDARVRRSYSDLLEEASA